MTTRERGAGNLYKAKESLTGDIAPKCPLCSYSLEPVAYRT